MAIVLALLLGGTFLIYRVTDASCRSRGGHTEVIWGGRGGWVCVGASRG